MMMRFLFQRMLQGGVADCMFMRLGAHTEAVSVLKVYNMI
jgi:hypothetical protein